VSTLAHLRTGRGPRSVVLLHGFLGSARNLTTLARTLAEADSRLGIVALDLTGHGASPPLSPGADTGTLAADVLTTVTVLELTPPVTLVGHSLGGRVALRAAAMAPADVASVMLLDIAPGPLPRGGDVARVLEVVEAAPARFVSRAAARSHLTAAGLTVALADWLLLNLEPDTAGYRWRIDRAALAALHARIVGEDLWPVVEGPRPFAIRDIRAGASGYVSAADVARLQAAKCTVVTIEGAGHFLHVERPREVVNAIQAGLV
jgi:pimeloyl-ACP methyl ester carboxylesterase